MLIKFETVALFFCVNFHLQKNNHCFPAKATTQGWHCYPNIVGRKGGLNHNGVDILSGNDAILDNPSPILGEE